MHLFTHLISRTKQLPSCLDSIHIFAIFHLFSVEDLFVAMRDVDYCIRGCHVNTPPHIRRPQHLHAQILIHLPDDLDRVANRQVRVATEVRGDVSVAVDGGAVAAELGYGAEQADSAGGEGI